MSTGDQNNNSGNVGIQGGKSNMAEIGLQIQSGNQVENTINWTQMTEELEQLRAAMEKEQNVDPDHQLALGAVKAAEMAAKKGEGVKALDYLKRGGNSVLKGSDKTSIFI